MSGSEHRVRWYGVIPDTGEEVPRTRHMAGRGWGWEAVCSCGWRTRTGGAIKARVTDAVAEHRGDVRFTERMQREAAAAGLTEPEWVAREFAALVARQRERNSAA